MADNNLMEFANAIASLGKQGANNTASALMGTGTGYNQYMQQQLPQNVNQFQNATGLAALNYATPGSSYGYTAPAGMMMEALFKKPVSTGNIANSQQGVVPLSAMANAQTLLNDRAAQGAAMMGEGAMGANRMEYQAQNSPTNAMLLNPAQASNAAQSAQALQQTQLKSASDLYDWAKTQGSPEQQAKILSEINNKFNTSTISPTLTEPVKLIGNYSPSDISQQKRIGDTLTEATPLAAQYQVAAAQAPQNRQALNTASGALSTLAPTDFSGTSNKWDAFISNMAPLVGSGQADKISQARSMYTTNNNVDNARAYASAILGVSGDSQIDPKDIDKMFTVNKDGTTNFSPGALKDYFKTKAQNIDNNIYRDIVAQDTMKNLQGNYKLSPQSSGLNNFGAYVEKNALPLSQKVNNMTGAYKLPNSSNEIILKDPNGNMFPVNQAQWYALGRSQGKTDKELSEQLKQRAVTTKEYNQLLTRNKAQNSGQQ